MNRFRVLFSRSRMEQELEDELAFHIEMETRKNVAAGMPPDQAARAARVQFGTNPSAVRDYVRDTSRIGFVETLFQDIRYALRGFRRTPLFALTVIGTIALGLGWNTAAFTIFNAYLLHPIAARDPYSLYGIGWQDRTGANHWPTWSQLDELREEHPALAEVTALLVGSTRMDGRFTAYTLVDGNYFHMLGVNAVIGRTLSPEDTTSPGSSSAVVLSHTAWQNRFGAAADIVGRQVLIHGHPFTVAGVMPEGFTGLGHLLPDIWAPLTAIADFEDVPDFFVPNAPARIGISVRLKPGENTEQARAALTAWMQRLAPELKPHATLTSLATPLPSQPSYYAAFFPILLVFFLVLLSACANVANMMLARAMSRQREIGIRLSLGAGRGRLIRQLLTESVLLSIPAAIAGFAISQALITLGLRWLIATIPSGFSDYVRLAPLSPDVHVFWFMIGAAILVALLFGLAPAAQATRLDVMQAARGDFSSEFRPARLRNALVITQVTVCGFLLIGVGVLLRSSNHVQNLDPGVRTRDVIELGIQEKSRTRVIDTLRVQPNVEMLAATSDTPLDATLPDVSATGDPNAGLLRTGYKYASPEYFQALEIPILRGRNFTAAEAHAGGPAIILSESAARKLWPNRDALGQSLRLNPLVGQVRGGRPPRYQTAQVIGIARDSSVRGAFETDRSCLFFPTDLEDPYNVLLVRSPGDPEEGKRQLNAVIEESQPGAIEFINTLQAELAVGTWTYRVAYSISAVLGGIALLLTLSGIYAVLSYAVVQRTKEIGIRVAMGASTRAVTGLVLNQCMRLAAIGIAAGSALALGAAQLLSAFTARISIDVFDTVAYAGGIAVVLTACLAGAFFPARRASRVDPNRFLRYD